jgi:multidrug efflux pump subunit AcrA (membrane-fusion protein)
MQARVQFDALRSLRLPAQIESIALLGNDSGGIVSYDVTLALDELDLRVRDGMTAEAAVIVDERQNVVMVPNQFIRLDRETGRAFVNLMGEDSSLEEIAIELGLQGQDSSEVVAGLNSGDVIALDLSADRISFFGG